MANPQFKSEAAADQGGGAGATLLMPTSFAANDIIIIIVATSGDVPSLSTANGFALATDPNGNVASVTTNGGVAGANDCGLFAFWKRATSSSDAGPVLATPAGGSWCCEANAYSGCRTSGTPFHIIATQIVGTATTTIAPPAVTPTLNACTVLPVAASANDDQAFNNWTGSGSASPAFGAADTGWHSGTGNACAFNGGIGGFATVGGARSATSTFAASSKQAQFTLVLASLPEAPTLSAWMPDFSDVAPRRTLSAAAMIAGLVAPVFVPAAPAPAESWLPSFSDAARRAPMAAIVGGGAQPEATLPNPVPSSAGWQPYFPDAAPRVRAAANVGGQAAPEAVLVGAAAPPLSWTPSFPSRAPRAPAAAIMGGATQPEATIPNVAPPLPSWAPGFPDAAPRSRQAAVIGGPAQPDATLPNAIALLPSWSPGFPDAARRARAATIVGGATQPEATIPNAPAPALSWAPSFPDAAAGLRRAANVGGGFAPVATIATPSSAPSVGAHAFREKANTTTPNTGTVTTLAVYPAWTPSTAYQIINDPRVTNGGNSYELATSGTSASSGGPSGTPAQVTNGAVSDNTAKWNWLEAGTGACDTQTSGSLFLISTGQGNDATSGTTPTDNKGNTYSIVGSKSFYAGFPQSSAATYVAALPSTGGTGHTVSGTYGAGLDGGGDERTLAFVEVIGGAVIKDHSQGEFNPVANVCTSNPVTTNNAALLVCFCWLNGTVQADGFLHTALPGSGWTRLGNASGLLEIANGAGQVQMCTIVKQVSAPGTYTATITTAGGEGAVMHLLAVQATSSAAAPAMSWSPDFPDAAPRARSAANITGEIAPLSQAGSPSPMVPSWSAEQVDVARRQQRPPEVGGATAPPSQIGSPSTLLSWSTAAADVARRAQRASEVGGEISPLPPPLDTRQLAWSLPSVDAALRRSSSSLAGETAPAPSPIPSVASWTPASPDRAARARTAPSDPLAAPLPNPPPVASWSPGTADAARRPPLAIPGGAVQPEATLPNAAAPALSWAPSFPDAARRARGAAIVGGPAAPEATIPNPPAPALSWAPVFPDLALRAQYAAIVGGPAQPEEVILDPFGWIPVFPDLAARARSGAVVIAAGPTQPEATIPRSPAPLLAWAPTFPDLAPRPRAAPIMGGAAAPELVVPGAPIPPSWEKRVTVTARQTGLRVRARTS